MIIKSKNLSIAQIASSGQCFRMNRIFSDTHSLIAFGRYIELKQLDEETVEISCSEEEYKLLWKDYFDLDYDYGKVAMTVKDNGDDFLQKALEYGSGIRILRQEPFEALISFIISQNKNIPSIKRCIERLCEKYGEEIIINDSDLVYYAFPAPAKLAAANIEDLRDLKLGYRDDYILKASQAVAEGAINLEALKECSYEVAVSTLKGIRGIGDKVANCVSLYGLHHIEAFPVDVWIKKILTEVYGNNFDAGIYKGFAGIIQQYMFYYIRHINGINV